MNFDHLFEDLEAQFEAGLATEQASLGLSTKKLAQVDLLDGSSRVFVAPVLGFDFIAGLLIGEVAWQLVPFVAFVRLTFLDSESSGLPPLRRLDLGLIGFLERLPRPAHLKWRLLASDQIRLGQLIELEGNLLALQVSGSPEVTFHPVAAFQSLEVMAVENLGEDF